MALRLKIIMNPSSGRETARTNVEDMISYLSSLGELQRSDIYYTSKQFDATEFAKNTPKDEYDYIIAVGGDGTVNEVATGMIEGGVTIPLAIYSSGTVNDFSTINGLPSLPSDFARMLMKPSFRTVDCGKANDKYFLNVLAGGLMTEVAYKVPSDLKTAFGPAAYWLSAMKDLTQLNQTICLSFTTDEQTYEAETILFLISNSRSVGGFRKLMTKADLSDGLLDVLVVKKMDPLDVVPLLGKLMVGEHINSDNVIYFQSDKIIINSVDKEHVRLDLDGEKGPLLPCKVECIPSVITLVVPGESDEE